MKRMKKKSRREGELEFESGRKDEGKARFRDIKRARESER